MGEMMSSLQPFQQVSGCPGPGDAAAADRVCAEGKWFVQLGVWEV